MRRGDGNSSARRRHSPRVLGPFEARWRGVITVPLVLHDLSVGGCLILASDTTLPSQRMTLDVRLPDEGWITVDAEPLHVRTNYGFAVRFVDVPEVTRERLRRTVARLAGIELTAFPK